MLNPPPRKSTMCCIQYHVYINTVPLAIPWSVEYMCHGTICENPKMLLKCLYLAYVALLVLKQI